MTPAIAPQSTKNYCLIPVATLRQARKFCSGQWVNLIEPLTSLCFEEALLLCLDLRKYRIYTLYI